jgi:hypothetical protein
MLNVPTLITSGTNLNLHAELDQSSDSSPLTHSHSSLDAHPTSLRESQLAHCVIEKLNCPDRLFGSLRPASRWAQFVVR